MKKLNQVKLKRMAHVLQFVMQVSFWVCIVGTVVSVITALIISFIPQQKFIGWGQFNLTIDNFITYEVNTQTLSNVSAKPILLTILLMTTILFFGIAILLRQLRDLLKTVAQDNPFAEENAKRITVIGVIFLVGSVVYKATAVIVAMTIINTYNLYNVNVNFKPDGFMLFTGFIVLILAGIFQYGSFLQQEYDSTI
ncbi:MAG: DUF2975 domain-containing protein [Halanaerobiales bacterium]|nr:DUF2975 domain-containing protein [Halanaerobiales bacterium]